MIIDTRTLQLELLKMMKQFHVFCKENELTYYMVGGTCLGSVRHKGFIPWDDDMDLGMPRKDYEKLCGIAKELLPDDLELRFYRTTSDSPFHYAKLINKNTTLIEPKYHNYIEGIYIDLFPLDGISDYGLKNRIRCRRIWLKHASIMNHCSTEKKRGVIRKAFQLYSRALDLNKLHESLNKLMIVENKKSSQYLCNFLGAYKEKEIVPAELFGEPVLYRFEDTELYGPSDPHRYLRHIYGEYMKLPPKEERVGRHNYYYVDLSLPYREYLKKLDEE